MIRIDNLGQNILNMRLDKTNPYLIMECPKLDKIDVKINSKKRQLPKHNQKQTYGFDKMLEEEQNKLNN